MVNVCKKLRNKFRVNTNIMLYKGLGQGQGLRYKCLGQGIKNQVGFGLGFKGQEFGFEFNVRVLWVWISVRN